MGGDAEVCRPLFNAASDDRTHFDGDLPPGGTPNTAMANSSPSKQGDQRYSFEEVELELATIASRSYLPGRRDQQRSWVETINVGRERISWQEYSTTSGLFQPGTDLLSCR
jgi:hypothetical protein